MDADELPMMDSYREVAQQGQAAPPSPTYVLDSIELEHYVLVYVPELVYLEYMVPSGDDIPVKDQPYVVNASPTALSSGYVADSELEEGLEEDPIDYAADADDDKEEEDESLEDNHDKEEDHLASADSTIVVSLAVDHANVRRRQSEEFHTRHQDDQEDRAALRDEVDTLR
nr:hypothetical protein [Tanacetum cinerariifolium]